MKPLYLDVWKKRRTMLKNVLVAGLLAAILVGCDAAPATEVATLTPLPAADTAVPATTTPTATSTPAATETSSRIATATTTPAPTWTAVRDTSRQMCGYDRWSPEKLPDLDALRWEWLGEDVRHLSGFEYRPIALNAAPNGTAVATPIGVLQSGGLESSIALLDVQGSAHRWWARETYHTANTGFAPWLPDGRMIRATDNTVEVGQPGAWEAIAAPEPMRYVRYAADGIVFAAAHETDTWWRLNLATETWGRVPKALPTFRISIAQDGSHVAGYTGGTELWHAPVEMGAPATVVTHAAVEELGSGRTPLPPVHLANSPYWWVDMWMKQVPEIRIGGRYLVTQSGLVVHTHTGVLLRHEALPVPTQFTHDTEYAVPSDGEWLAVELLEIVEKELPQVVSRGLYVAPSGDLHAGNTIEGVEVAGWVTEPEAIVVRTRPTDTLAVAPLPVTSQMNPIPLDGAGDLLTPVHGGVVTTDAAQPARLLLYNLDGAVIDTLDLSDRYDVIARAFAASNRVYLTATDEDPNNCTYSLVEWTVPTGRQRTGEKE